MTDSERTAAIAALVIERAELIAAYEFPPYPEADTDRDARMARNKKRQVRIAQTYADTQRLITGESKE